MFGFSNRRLYRKFLFLGVMLVSLSVLSSARSVRTEDPCCEACNATAAACVEFCWTTETIKDWMRYGCAQDCETARVACRQACTPVGAPEVCLVS